MLQFSCKMPSVELLQISYASTNQRSLMDCETCSGSRRFHSSKADVCSGRSDCPGCFKCPSCFQQSASIPDQTTEPGSKRQSTQPSSSGRRQPPPIPAKVTVPITDGITGEFSESPAAKKASLESAVTISLPDTPQRASASSPSGASPVAEIKMSENRSVAPTVMEAKRSAPASPKNPSPRQDQRKKIHSVHAPSAPSSLRVAGEASGTASGRTSVSRKESRGDTIVSAISNRLSVTGSGMFARDTSRIAPVTDTGPGVIAEKRPSIQVVLTAAVDDDSGVLTRTGLLEATEQALTVSGVPAVLQKVASVKARLEEIRQESTASMHSMKNHFASMELLNDRRVTSKNRDTFAQSSEAEMDIGDLSPMTKPERASLLPKRRSSNSGISALTPVSNAQRIVSASNPAMSVPADSSSKEPLIQHVPVSVSNRIARSVDRFPFAGTKAPKKSVDEFDVQFTKETNAATLSRPASSHPALNMSGGVNMRKNGSGGGGSPISPDLPTPNIGHKSSHGSLGGGGAGAGQSPDGQLAASPKKLFGRGFKEWYNGFLHECTKKPENVPISPQFPEIISLETIFGSKSNLTSSIERMMWAARCGEIVKNSPEWVSRDGVSSPESIPPLSPGSYEDVFSARVLDIFKDEPLDSLTYTTTSTGNMQIVAAGPIDSLLDALIFPLINDMSYAEVFFATYRFFLSPSHVLASLIKWYNVVLPTIVPGSPGYPQLRKSEGFERTQSQMVFYRRHRKYIQARAIKCMLLWVTNHWLDFQTNPGMLSELQSFVNEISSVSFGDSQKISHAIREQRLSWYTLQYISPFPPRFGTYIPTPYGCINEEAGIGNIPGHSAGLSSAQNSAGPSAAAIAAAALAMTTGMSPTTHPPPQWALPTHQQLQTRPWISVWEPEWFAQQITLVDHFLYRQIRPDSYLHLLHNPVGVAGAGRDQGLKVILDAVEWFRLVSLYTGSVILNEDGQKRRSKMIKRFIKVVKEARRLRNYSLVFAVVHGLRLPAVARLSSAWEGLPTKYLDMFKELSAVTEPQGGFANYWAELRLTQPPAVPYLAAYIHDLMEIHEEAPVYLTGRSYSPSLPTPGTTGTDSRPISPSSEYSHTSHVTQSSHATSHTSTTNPHSTHTGYSATSEGSEGDSVLGQIINFRKFYSLYSIVAEMEVFRTSSYREPGPLFSLAPTTNSSTDSSAQVLQQTQNNGSPSSVSGLVGAIPPSPFSLPVADKDALSYLVTHVKDYLSRSDEVLEWFETQPQSDASQRGTFGRAMKRMSSLLALQKRGSSPLPQESSDVGEDVYE